MSDFDLITYPSPDDHAAIGRFLELEKKSHVALFRAARLSPCGSLPYGALVKVALGAATDTTGGVAKNTFTVQVKDGFDNNIAAKFRGWVGVESCDDYAGNLSLFVFYKLTETGAGAAIDSTFADGSPVGKKGKPRLYFETDANGAATITVERLRADGITAAVTDGGNLADVRLLIKLDIQPEAIASVQRRRCTAFT